MDTSLDAMRAAHPDATPNRRVPLTRAVKLVANEVGMVRHVAGVPFQVAIDALPGLAAL
jgi:hypothetical protein